MSQSDTPSTRDGKVKPKAQPKGRPRPTPRKKQPQTPQTRAKRRAFVAAFLGPAAGNSAQAAKLAGYSPKTAAQQGSRLLTFVDVRKQLETKLAQLEQVAILDAEKRDMLMSLIALDPAEETRDRIRAVNELNRCSGRHSQKHILDVGERLEDILTRSRVVPAERLVVGGRRDA